MEKQNTLLFIGREHHLNRSLPVIKHNKLFTYVEQAKRYKNVWAERYVLTYKVSTNVSTNVGASLEDLLAVNLLQSNSAPGFYTLKSIMHSYFVSHRYTLVGCVLRIRFLQLLLVHPTVLCMSSSFST